MKSKDLQHQHAGMVTANKIWSDRAKAHPTLSEISYSLKEFSEISGSTEMEILQGTSRGEFSPLVFIRATYAGGKGTKAFLILLQGEITMMVSQNGTLFDPNKVDSHCLDEPEFTGMEITPNVMDQWVTLPPKQYEQFWRDQLDSIMLPALPAIAIPQAAWQGGFLANSSLRSLLTIIFEPPLPIISLNDIRFKKPEHTTTRKPHTAYIVHELKKETKRGESWKKLKALASESLGKNPVKLPGYGSIYLKRDWKKPASVLRYKNEEFKKSDDGELIKKSAFDTAWNAANKGNIKET